MTVTEDGLNSEILQAAMQLFSKYGLKKTTMDDVAKAVGKGKSTLYYYYPGKSELFEAVVRHEIQNAVKVLRLAVNNETSATNKLKVYLVSRLKLKQDYDNLSKVIFEDVFDHFKEIFKLKKEFETVHQQFISEIIKNGVQTGEFKSMSEEEIIFFSSWINAAFVGLELPSQSSFCLASTDTCGRLVDMILSGISFAK